MHKCHIRRTVQTCILSVAYFLAAVELIKKFKYLFVSE